MGRPKICWRPTPQPGPCSWSGPGAAPKLHRFPQGSSSRLHCTTCSLLYKPQMSHNQDPVLRWYTQNHASRIKKADIRSYFWLGSSLTNLHLPESVLIARGSNEPTGESKGLSYGGRRKPRVGVFYVAFLPGCLRPFYGPFYGFYGVFTSFLRAFLRLLRGVETGR